jgi:hypothetical protein
MAARRLTQWESATFTRVHEYAVSLRGRACGFMLLVRLWTLHGALSAPRLGFAYEVVPNTVVRGAFGVYYYLLPASYLGVAFSTPPFSGSQTFTQPTGSQPAFTMHAPFSATGAFAANPTVNAQHTTVTPYTEQYNLAVEHQFSKGLDIRIGYVGRRNIKQNNASGSGNVAPDINLNTPQGRCHGTESPSCPAILDDQPHGRPDLSQHDELVPGRGTQAI